MQGYGWVFTLQSYGQLYFAGLRLEVCTLQGYSWRYVRCRVTAGGLYVVGLQLEVCTLQGYSWRSVHCRITAGGLYVAGLRHDVAGAVQGAAGRHTADARTGHLQDPQSGQRARSLQRGAAPKQPQPQGRLLLQGGPASQANFLLSPAAGLVRVLKQPGCRRGDKVEYVCRFSLLA